MTDTDGMSIHLKIWRQANPDAEGSLVDYTVENVHADMSFLEMLDVLNNQLIRKGEEPVAFEHDCREGICGSCALVVNGEPHGPWQGTTVCQVHMRHYKEGDTIVIEPFRAKGFPVLKDLVVDRSSFDRIIAAGGYISVKTGNAPDANAIPVPKEIADRSFNAATCIGCGACVAVCKNASAALFVSAKLAHLNLLPQGHPEKDKRVLGMVRAMDAEGFGNCSNTLACEAICPKNISTENIARMNREYAAAAARERREG